MIYHEIDVIILAKINQKAIYLSYFDLIFIFSCDFSQEIDSLFKVEYRPKVSMKDDQFTFSWHSSLLPHKVCRIR